MDKLAYHAKLKDRLTAAERQAAFAIGSELGFRREVPGRLVFRHALPVARDGSGAATPRSCGRAHLPRDRDTGPLKPSGVDQV